MICKHEDFDEYFGECFECKATRQQVIKDQFIEELQAVYKKMQDSLGIEHGDIEPSTALVLDKNEQTLAQVVSFWIDNLYESEA